MSTETASTPTFDHPPSLDHIRARDLGGMGTPATQAAVDRRELLRRHAVLADFVTYVCEEVSRIGCEGSSDEICAHAEIPKENWCPWCLLGEQVQKAHAAAK